MSWLGFMTQIGKAFHVLSDFLVTYEALHDIQGGSLAIIILVQISFL